MLKQTGASYASAKYGKALFLAESKVGKSSFLVASALGLLPWQKSGGVVDKPENLHIFTFDSSALAGIAGFLRKTCGGSEAGLAFNVYNFQDEARKGSTEGWDFSLLENIRTALEEVRRKARSGGTHVVIISSLTGLAMALKRALAGPIGQRDRSGKYLKSAGMDIPKWDAYGALLNEIRNEFQDDLWHCFFEAHIFTKEKGEQTEESLLLQGQAGANFAVNVEQIFRVRRLMGQKFEKSSADKVYLDTRPSIGCIANGRGFNENLDAQEPDLAAALKKLGLTVGGWLPTASQPAQAK